MISIEKKIHDIEQLSTLINLLVTTEKSLAGQTKLLEELNLIFCALIRNYKIENIIRNKYGRFNAFKKYALNANGIHFDLLANAIVIFGEESQNAIARTILEQSKDIFFAEMHLLGESMATIVNTEIHLLAQEAHSNLELTKKLKDCKKSLPEIPQATVDSRLIFTESTTEVFFCKKLLNYTRQLLISYPNLLSADKMSREERYIFAYMLAITWQAFDSIPFALKQQKFDELFRLMKKTRHGIAHGHSRLIYNFEENLIDALKEKSLLFFQKTCNLFEEIENFSNQIHSYENIINLQKTSNLWNNGAIFGEVQTAMIELGSLFGVTVKKPPVPKVKIQTNKGKKEKKPQKVVTISDLKAKLDGLRKSIDGIDAKLSLLDGDKNSREREALFKEKRGIVPTEEMVRNHFINERTKLEILEKETLLQYQTLLAENPDIESSEAKKEKKINKNLERPTQEISKILEKMARECEYLEELLNKKTVHDFVIEYAMTVVGQLGRDLNDAREKDTRIDSLAPSEYLESLHATIQMRNSKLHNIIKAGNVSLAEMLFRDTLPMLPEIQAMRNVIEITEQDIASQINIAAWFTLGYSYLQLRKYDKAIETFKSIQTSFLNHAVSPTPILNTYIGLATAYGNKANDYYGADRGEWEKILLNKCYYLTHCLELIISLGTNFETGDQKLQVTKLFDPTIESGNINVITDILQAVPNHLKVATLLNNCAGAYALLGYHDFQVRCLEKAIQIAHQLKDGVRESKYLNNLAVYCYETAKQQDKNLPQGSHNVEFHGHLQAERAIACAWQAKRLLEYNNNQHSLFYIDICINLCKALLLSHHPYLIATSLEVLQLAQQVITTLPARKKDFEIKSLNQIQAEHTKIITALKDYKQIPADYFSTINKNTKELWLMSVVTRGLAGVYQDLAINLDLSHEFDTVINMASDEEDEITKIRRLHVNGVKKYTESNFQDAVDYFLQILSLMNAPYFTNENMVTTQKRIWIDLGKAYYGLEKFAEAANYFEKCIDLVIADQIKLDDEIVDLLVRLGKINSILPTRFISLCELIDEKYRTYSSSFNKYDLMLQNLAIQCLNSCEYEKALVIQARVVNSLTSLQLSGNQALLEVAIKLLASAQNNYQFDLNTQQVELSKKFDFYLNINRQLNFIKKIYTNDALDNAIKASKELLKSLREQLAKDNASLETTLAGLRGVNFFKGVQHISILDRLVKKYALKDQSQSELEKGLRQAAVNGYEDDLRHFISHVANINSISPSSGNTALHWAAKNAHIGCIKLLLANYAMREVLNKEQLKPEDLLPAEHAAKQLFVKTPRSSPLGFVEISQLP
ncbi:MAG: ankyrin repeat domain-containing protein [Gammaproteobacteria bacterium]|nr:ankyrin repeat domain-containing protein [Gammaproteobacteria bacterium]